jgi:hypothetical protein
VAAVYQHRYFVAESREGVGEPDRLGTERSVRGSEDADQDLLFQS